MGGGFRFEINVEPKDIPNLDDVHKRDCADAVSRAVDSVFKYTMVFCALVVIFFGLYSFFSMHYMMRTMKMLPQLTIIFPIAAVVCCVFEFFAGAMQRWAMVLEIIVMAVVLAVSLMLIQTVWIIPFAAFGIIEHIKLFTTYPFYKAISEQPGYPEFTALPTKDEVVRRKPEAEASAASKPDEEAEKAENIKENEKTEEPENTAVSEETAKPEDIEKFEAAGKTEDTAKTQELAGSQKKAESSKPSGKKKRRKKSRPSGKK